MEKQCSRCKRLLPRNAFARHTQRRDGLQGHCQKCHRLYDKEHYRRHRDRRRTAIIAWNRTRREEHYRLTFDFLSKHPCVDCGESNPIVLEFDHVRGVKAYAIGALVRVGCSYNTLLSEMKKCEVRCANCHRIRTAHARGYGRVRVAKERGLSSGADPS